MTPSDSRPDEDTSEELAALRAIVEGTARHTGQEFFQSLVRHLAAAVGTRHAFVAVFAGGGTRARTLASWSGDRLTDNIEWDVMGTPCEDVVHGNLCHYPAGVSQRFPDDKRTVSLGIESYLGVPLLDAQGTHLGHLAVFDERPMPAEPRKLFIFRIFATRAAAELERLQYEERLQVSEQRWRSLTEELRQLNARLDLAVRGSNIAIWEYDLPDGKIENSRATYINGAESLGYDPSVAATDYATMLAYIVPSDDHERMWREVREFLASDRPVFETEARVRHRDGSDRWHLARGVAVRDAARKPIRFVGSSVDITDRKRAEEALRASEERFRTLARATNDAVWDWDLGTNKVWWNEGILALFGYRLETNETDPAWWLERIHPDDRATVEAFVFDVVRGRELSWVDEYRFRCADGSYKDVYDRGYLLRDADGQATRMIGAMLDITDRRRAEEELRLAKNRLELAVRGSDIGIWDLDMPDGNLQHARISYVNIWEPLGYEPTEFPSDRETGMSPVHPDDRPPMEEAIRSYLAGETSKYEIESRARHKDGSYRWRLSRGVAVRDAQGKPIRFVGSGVDITDLKRAEEEINRLNQELRSRVDEMQTILDVVPIGIGIAHDPECRLITHNPYLSEATGVPLGENASFDAPPDERPGDHWCYRDGKALLPEEMPMQLACAGMDVRDFEMDMVRTDGRSVKLLCYVRPLKDAQGRIRGSVGGFLDITARRKAEEELRRAKEAAEAANRAKDEFLANVSHEIRTPMNAILGMTELVLDTPLADDQRQCLRTAKSAADSLLGIINDLLDFAKIEAGRLELDLGDFSLRSAVGSTLRALAARAHRKGLEVVCNVQPDVSDALIGDAGRLRQVLLNLVGNAIKFTEKGEVVVQVEAEPGAEPAGRQEVVLRFSVRDTGIGIPPGNQERIFRAFEQEDTSTTRKYGGTGLGLAIAARLVALMGGQIRVSSAPGHGSTFVFTARFKLQAHPAEPAAAQPSAHLRNLPVLIIDDNATNRQILVEWLRGWQMAPAAAGDGVAAMDALWEAASQGRPYALVLLDARMPDTDGLALAAQIRKRAELSATRIILLSSGDRPGDWDRFRELRIDVHLLKPIQQDELLDRIYQVMSLAKGDEPTEARLAATRELPPAPAPVVPLHVLLAEDDEFSARFMEHLLSRKGHRVARATNGRQALSLAEEGGFDLLLLDIHMPELDGFEVVGAIRERERAAGGHLPVIALTARSRKEDREHCLAAGMDDFLTKPVAAAHLLAALDRLNPAPRVPRPDRADRREGGSPLDPAAVLTACGDDAEGLRRMCEDFQTYTPARLAEMSEALRDRDAPRLRRAAHKSCPLLLAFSTVAGNMASDLEDHAARGQLEEARPLVERLAVMAQELMRLVDGLSLEALHEQIRHANEL